MRGRRCGGRRLCTLWARIVVLGGVEDGEVDADSLGNIVGAGEIVGTDCEYLSTSVFDFVVVSLQLT